MVNVAWSTGRGQPLSASSTRLQAVSVLPCYCSNFREPIIIWKRKCLKFVSPRDEILHEDQPQGNKGMMITRRSIDIVPCLEVGLWTSSTYHLHGLSFKTLLLCVKHILYCFYSRSSRKALRGCIFMNASICASLLLVKWVTLGCAAGANCTFVHLGDVGSVVGRERKPSQFREGALRRITSWVARYTLHL